MLKHTEHKENIYEFTKEEKIIAETGLSIVYSVSIRDKQNDEKKYALKVPHPKTNLSSSDITDFKNEIRLANFLSPFNHPQIVQFFIQEENVLSIAMELLDSNLLSFYRSPHYSQAYALLILDQMIKGLQFLHEQRILHLDLKSKNILISFSKDSITAKICDFGFTKFIAINENKVEVIGSTPGWSAPEIMLYRKAHFASDVFSLGIVAFELLTKMTPYANILLNKNLTFEEKHDQVAAKLKKREFDTLPPLETSENINKEDLLVKKEYEIKKQLRFFIYHTRQFEIKKRAKTSELHEIRHRFGYFFNQRADKIPALKHQDSSTLDRMKKGMPEKLFKENENNSELMLKFASMKFK